MGSALKLSLGQSGLEVGPLAYGLWRFVGTDVRSATQRIETALDTGMTLIDVAAVYGLDWGGKSFGESEALLGKVLAASGGLRSRMVLATKFGIIPGVPYDSSREAVIGSCEDSLKRLRADVIDLFQVHRPDVLTHPVRTRRRAFDTCASRARSGKPGSPTTMPGRRLLLQQYPGFSAGDTPAGVLGTSAVEPVIRWRARLSPCRAT
jgi:aryl-alcohol dehydrogenase-like predicted oxidoreductase